MITLLRNLLFYPVFYLGSLPIVLSGFLSLPVGQPAVRAATHVWTAWHRWCVRWLLGIKVRVEGEMLDRPCIYAMKHESFFEAIDAPHLFRLPAPFAKSELFAIPGWGRVARAYGLVEVSRADGAKALRRMIAEARNRSQAGRPLVIFPEGTRSPHDRRAPLQPGFLGIYKLLSLPVVPVSVDSGPLYQPGLKRSGTITYRFGEVIEPGLPRDEVERLVQEGINALGEQGLRPPAQSPTTLTSHDA
ncbi:1-acylglycerol-3-phosphate O-acyltransferase [Alteripontixanthobacter maritimus]|uniref:1-acylglycerol-3-phosphate O-acyltransferase n=1 Tax=Alteripontixanthobacter maritimus TaxID=2161824 RepID=A0A369Q8Y2_9SPHN|nr:lysophospholipid acyltransferase family protein [Alteripontixanthobacter maritimus]RDC58889.1 1-acylglycerol-3-phosphate O-acyltransferase [Alteripontixanthobacter maritimus]RDC61341.1 1-acylglycerol-3-phosphate O-acyltransferase [Alteripontixanthobacter maritimus]